MADFNKPVKTDSHANVWDYAKARAEDIATWFDSRRADATNISEHTKRWNDTAKCWERWNGSAWVADVTLGIAGGGTGTTTAAGIRSAINVEDGADVTDAGNVGAVIHAAAAKTTPVDADEAPLIDSAASNVIKKVTWTNIKATLKTYFDTLYAATAKGVTNGDSHDHNGGDGAAIVEAAITLADNTTDNVSTSKHGFAPKSPNDGTKFLDGLGAYDTVKDSDLATTDITTNNVTTAKHGFVPKAPNDTTKYLRGDATWAAPPGGFPNYVGGTTVNVNTIYQASANGYLCIVVWGSYRNGIDILVGSASPPTILVGRFGDDINANTKAGSILVPIELGTYYKVLSPASLFTDAYENISATFYPA